MHVVMFLSIENASTFSINVVGAPFAVKRGGASPHPSALKIIKQHPSCLSSS